MSITFFVAIAIFLITYGLIISEKVHRTIIALFGACLMIILGILNQEQALEGVDFNTLGLLIGIMIIVTIARQSGMFQYVAIWAAKVGKGKPVAVFLLLGVIIALFSAFLDNVTTVLLMVPVTLVVTHNLSINPKPFLIGAILLSNIGGAATLIGDPPNILIGSAAELTFNDFLVHMGPISVLISVVTLGLLYIKYRKVLVTTPEASASVMKFNPKDAISDKGLLIKSLVVLGLVIIGFFTHATTHLEVATIALAGAALLLLLTVTDPEDHLKEVEWTTIFFFVGLFILVAGLEQVGAIRLMAEKLIDMTQANMIPLIYDVGSLTGLPLQPLWWAITLGADIGGNSTIVGASANVVVSGMATR